jgi:hypothetical protein
VVSTDRFSLSISSPIGISISSSVCTGIAISGIILSAFIFSRPRDLDSM